MILAFLSDFGLKDPYVGIVKAVVLGINPALRIVDISHQVAPQDVMGGSFVLGSAFREFPPGTVFLAVVDPGVGSQMIGLGRYGALHVSGTGQRSFEYGVPIF
jgi:S-adenosylmethionine hydrolase